MKSMLKNKKVLLSLGTLLAVGAATVGLTGAFYNDTEASTDNIFVAGTVDLQVDHLKQTYNGEDCTTRCNRWAQEVTSFDQGLRKDGSPVTAGRSDATEALGEADTSGSAIDVSPTGFVSLGFGGSITLHFPDGIDDGPGDDIRIYEATGGTYPDEQIKVEVSPNNIDWVTVDVDPESVTFDGAVEIDLDGDAPLVYYVRITDQSDPDLHSDNGDAFDLDAVQAIHCEDEEADGVPSDIWQCRLWEQTDLDDSYQFFSFSDIKPGDEGTNVISLHVEDNDAYACLIAHDAVDGENTVYDPELPDTDDAGELQNYIEFFTWLDLDADGEFDGDETAFGEYVLGEVGTLAHLDDDAGDLLTSEQTRYVGLAWCAGDLVVDGTTISCDGSAMLNDAQSDSYSASLTAYAEQVRNNPDFTCDAVDLETDEEEE